MAPAPDPGFLASPAARGVVLHKLHTRRLRVMARFGVGKSPGRAMPYTAPHAGAPFVIMFGIEDTVSNRIVSKHRSIDEARRKKALW
jgi:hypothetical protein